MTTLSNHDLIKLKTWSCGMTTLSNQDLIKLNRFISRINLELWNEFFLETLRTKQGLNHIAITVVLLQYQSTSFAHCQSLHGHGQWIQINDQNTHTIKLFIWHIRYTRKIKVLLVHW